ncbi:MAG: AMP-binding protein [Clostridiales Family XIII bacterium]|jgi:long-subunit acyl-CoA synthetase (AMP-forming)|nr:AMP-binding protein [Clostridiales Family XIII bacterium]
MAVYERMPEDAYAKIRERDEAWARGVYESLLHAEDKNVRFREGFIRPITDIKDMFDASARIYADRPAFHEKPTHKEPYRTYTYAEAHARVCALGTALIARGFHREMISVIGENSYAWSTAYLSIACGTGIVVPLDKELSIEEIEHLLVEADVAAVYYSKKYAPLFDEIRKRGGTKLRLFINQNAEPDELRDYEVSTAALIAEGEQLLADGNRDFVDAQIDAEKMAVLIFTSGTTGVAKGVMLSHRNFATQMMVPTTIIGITEQDVFFSFLPLHHTYEATAGFLIPLAQGGSIAYCEGLRHIVDNLAEAKPTLFLGVPLVFENLYKKIWQNARKDGKDGMLRKVMKVNRVTKRLHLDLGDVFFKKIRALFGGRMRLLICGGAAIDPAVIDGIKAFGINAIQGYGLTECAPIHALNPIDAGKSASAGYLVPGLDGKIDAPDPETGIGEILLRGDNVMLGYYNNPEATAEAMADGWYRTGDYGYIDADNFVFITGRKKSVIITKTGKNVFPEELEYKLGRSEIIAESMVWEKEAEQQDDTVIVVTLRASEEALSEALGEDYTQEEADRRVWDEVNKVNEELPVYKRIRRVYLREEDFESTTSRKIKRFVAENREGREI